MDLPEGLAVEPHPPLSVHLIHAQATRGREGEGKGLGGWGSKDFWVRTFISEFMGSE